MARSKDPLSLEEYMKAFDAAARRLLPKTNYPEAALGFLMATVSTTFIIVLTFDSFNLRTPLTQLQLGGIFVSFAAAFAGFMLLHRATKGDWL